MSSSNSTRRIIIFGTAAAALFLSVVLVFITLRTPAARASVSNQGTLVTPSQHDANVLGTNKDLTGEIFLLRQAAGRAFFRLPTVGGGNCYATSRAGSADHIEMLLCSPDFPANRAVLDFSVFGADRPATQLTVVSAQGIAADNVAKVSVIDGSGQEVASVPVTDNVYVLPDLSTSSKGTAVLAFDQAGRTLFRSGSGNSR